MNLNEISKISSLLSDFRDFFIQNADGDESGLYEETLARYDEVKKIINDRRYKLYLRNAKQNIKRKQNKHPSK